jgi:hypothetical protein
MDGYGASPHEALRDMNANIHEYVLALLQHCKENHITLEKAIRQVHMDLPTKGLWDKYSLVARQNYRKQISRGRARKRPIRKNEAATNKALRWQCFRPVRRVEEA